MIQSPKCLTCKFFQQTHPTQGACRRFPPTAHMADQGRMMSAFVTTRTTDFCGEYMFDILPATDLPAKEVQQ